MAHEIEQFENGEAAFASARLDAWHRLGVVTDGAMTAAEALRLAKLSDWNVRKVGLKTDDGSTVPHTFATVRTHPVSGAEDVLGVVGRKYHPIQNEDHTELLNTLVSMSGAHFETAGSLKGGREVFVSMKFSEHMSIGGADEVELYIVALNSHDGSSAFRMLISPVRVVCANTQAAALREARSSFSIRHTRGSKAAISQARAALGLTFKYQSAFQAEADAMIQKSLTDAAFMDIVGKLFPSPALNAPALQARRYRDKVDTLERLFVEASTNANIRGTRWAGYQAVTEYIDHYAPAQKTQWSSNQDIARAMRSLGPLALKTKERAHRLLSI